MKGGGTDHIIVRRVAAEHGQAAAEYGIILALIAAVAIASYQLLGTTVVTLYNQVVAAFT